MGEGTLGEYPLVTRGRKKGRPESRPSPQVDVLKEDYFFEDFFFEPKLVSTDPPMLVSICLAASA